MQEEKIYDDGGDDQETLLGHPHDRPQQRPWKRLLTPYFVLIALWLSSIIYFQRRAQARVDRASRLCGQLLYSPAEDLIRYSPVLFSQGFKPNVTEYYGPPTAERNALWKKLYDLGGGQGIPLSQAQHLVNATTPLPPTDPEKYYISLDFLHQLHCLDNIRLALFAPQTYANSPKKAGLLEPDHLYHCFEMLRQGIMCHSDISPIVMQWNEEKEMNILRADVLHACRNFWDLRAWAEQRGVRKVLWGEDNMDRGLVVEGFRVKEF